MRIVYRASCMLVASSWVSALEFATRNMCWLYLVCLLHVLHDVDMWEDCNFLNVVVVEIASHVGCVFPSK